MPALPPIPVHALACILLAGCSALKNKPPKEDKDDDSTVLVGIVEMVNPEQEYVLIRCEQMPAFSPGTELVAVSALGERSRLVLTPERKGWYITADIREGRPEVTHLVIHERAGAAGKLTPAPATPLIQPAMPPGQQQPSTLSLPSLPGLPEGFETSASPLPSSEP